MIELEINSKERNEIIDITNIINETIKNKKIDNGFLIIFVPHTTAGVFINEGADENVKKDIIHKLKKILPEKNNYLHIEGNSDAHIKASLFGSSEMVIIENKKIILGTWQHIFFYEGDGPRKRKIYIKLFSI